MGELLLVGAMGLCGIAFIAGIAFLFVNVD